MRVSVIVLSLCLILPLAVDQPAAEASSAVQQPGLRIPSLAPGGLLGGLLGLEGLRVSHAMAFSYTSGGPVSGPSGLFLTRFDYPLARNLDLALSLGMSWDPAWSDITGSSPTHVGLRELRLDWRPSRNTFIQIGYVRQPTWRWLGGYP
jgi:hypothetical protein